METSPDTAQALDAIARRAALISFTLPEVCDAAEVARSTIWRAQNKGAAVRPSTIRKLQDTVARLERERSSAVG